MPLVSLPVLRAALTSVSPTRAGTHGAERRIGAGGDREADAGEAEDQFVDLLAGREPRAFAHRVADVAEHEQVAERGAGEADGVVRFAGDEALGEILDVALRAGGGGVRGLDLGGERRLDRHLVLAGKLEKAVGEFGIVGGQRGLDLARRHLRLEHPAHGVIGERHRVVLDGDQLRRVRASGTRASAAIAAATVNHSGTAIRAPLIKPVSCPTRVTSVFISRRARPCDGKIRVVRKCRR